MSIVIWIILFTECLIGKGLAQYDDVFYKGTSYDLVLSGIGSAKYDSVQWDYLKSSTEKPQTIAYWFKDKTTIDGPFIGRVTVNNEGLQNMTLHINSLRQNDTGVYRHSIVLANATETKFDRTIAVPYKVWRSCIKNKKADFTDLLTDHKEVQQLLKNHTDKFKVLQQECGEVEFEDGDKEWVIAEYFNGQVSCLASMSDNVCASGHTGASINGSARTVHSSIYLALILSSIMCLCGLTF